MSLAGGRLRVDEPAPHVARLTIASPEKRNALSARLLRELARDGVGTECALETIGGRRASRDLRTRAGGGEAHRRLDGAGEIEPGADDTSTSSTENPQ